MELETGSSRRDLVVTCVKLMNDLEHEIQSASSAIARNRLRDLEESLWRQETLCGRLKRSVSTICRATLNKDSTDLLCEAASRLRMQSQIYEKLVAQSSRSTAILQHLSSLYRNAARHSGAGMYRPMSREA
jgi:hypothetical protein